MPDDEFPEIPPTAIEKELAGPHRRRKGHPSHKETHPLTAAEEAGRRRKRPWSKAKKYDGRVHSKDAVVSRAKVREALESFYKDVGLPELKQALEASNDPRYNMLLAAINNPRLNGCSFAELCRKCRMSIQDVVEVWRNHLKTQGIVRMMGHMPDIMEDVALDSKSRTVVCDTCQGKGIVYGKEVNQMKDPICPNCHGDGSVRLMGDKDARLLAFETVGLKKGSGIMVGVNIDNRKGGAPSMEDQIADIDKVFDAEYTEVKEEKSGPTGNGSNGNEAAAAGSGDSHERNGGAGKGLGNGSVASQPDAGAATYDSKSIFDDDPLPAEETDGSTGRSGD